MGTSGHSSFRGMGKGKLMSVRAIIWTLPTVIARWDGMGPPWVVGGIGVIIGGVRLGGQTGVGM